MLRPAAVARRYSGLTSQLRSKVPDYAGADSVLRGGDGGRCIPHQSQCCGVGSPSQRKIDRGGTRHSAEVIPWLLGIGLQSVFLALTIDKKDT